MGSRLIISLLQEISMRQVAVALFAITLLPAPRAAAQSSAGTVSGTLRDQTGAVIPSAAVSLINNATNITASTTTNEAGFYRFPGVAPGEYRLTAETPGMQKFEGALLVQVGQSA